MDTEPKEPLFRDIDADDEDNVTTVESFCVACHENVSMLEYGMETCVVSRQLFFSWKIKLG